MTHIRLLSGITHPITHKKDIYYEIYVKVQLISLYPSFFSPLNVPNNKLSKHFLF